MRNTAQFLACLFVGVLVACSPDGKTSTVREEPVTQVATTPAPEDQLAIFTANLDERPTLLRGGASSLNALAERFVRGVQERDTAGIRSIHVSKAEFAYLVYPTHPQALPPYSLPPEVVWMMTESSSAKALDKIVAMGIRQGASIQSVVCEGVTSQGKNRVHSGCVAIAQESSRGEEIRIPLGPIIERDGRFKFASFAAG